jgi:hypothetical protein
VTAWILAALLCGLGTIGVGCWRAIDRDADPVFAEHPGTDEQWPDLVAAMRSVRRRRSRARRAVRRAH